MNVNCIHLNLVGKLGIVDIDVSFMHDIGVLTIIGNGTDLAPTVSAASIDEFRSKIDPLFV